MHGKMNDSKKIAIAVISLCFVALYLAVFSVMVYKGKRSNSILFPITSDIYITQDGEKVLIR